MSVHTLPPAAGFGDWDDLLKFAAITRHVDLDLPESEGPVRSHRPARAADRRAAIERSMRGEA